MLFVNDSSTIKSSKSFTRGYGGSLAVSRSGKQGSFRAKIMTVMDKSHALAEQYYLISNATRKNINPL